MSFRLKTILGIALIETLLLLVLVFSSLSFLYDSNERQLLERAETTANLFASATKDSVLATDLARLDSFVGDILRHSEVAYVRIKSADGTVLAEGGSAEHLNSEHLPDQGIRSVDDGVFDKLVTIEEAGILFGSIELGLSTAAISSVFDEALVWATTIAISEVLLVALFSFLLGTYLTRGLSRLRVASTLISEQGPGMQVTVVGNDEIADVARSFNQMSKTLEKSYTELRESLAQRDITLQRAERNWAKNQAILASSLDAIITVDGHGNVIDYNPAAESIFGWSATEIKGQPMADFIIPEAMREAHNRGMKHYLKTGEGPVLNQRLQLQAMHKNGSQFPIELAISDTSTPEGPLFTAFLRDLTQHVADQTELRLAATAFETIEPMFITDKDARIIRANSAFTRVMGYEETDVIGQTPRLWSSGQHEPDFYQAMWAQLVKNGEWSGEIVNRRKNGDLFPELLSISAVFDEQGQITHYIAHLVDISEQKQREHALGIAIHDAQAADEAKGRFLAVMSHEIRTPMNAIIGILDLLLETPLNDHQRGLLNTGCESSWLLLSIINNILDFSKMEAGKLDLYHGVFDLHDTFNQSVGMFRNQADEKNIGLQLLLDPSVPRYAKGDGYRIRQVLINLVSNSMKFTTQGAVRVSATVSTDTSGALQLSCEVSDTGIGIPSDKLHLLFKEFSMVDQTHSRRTDGTGLGLVISKSLVEMMGGEIGVTSEEGTGSCFQFTVQLKSASDNEIVSAGATEESNTLDRPVHVLLAEDNPANQRVFEAMLSGTGISVDIVSDGQQACDALERQRYDLILMDISMPNMDGIAATTLIRQRKDDKGRIPIVAMTAHSLAGDKERFMDAGMNDYLSKPLKKTQLLASISRWAGKGYADEIAVSKTLNTEPDSALVDESVLAQLVADTSAEIVPELLRGYIEDSRERLIKISSAQQSKDGMQLTFEAHTLGSSAAAHGNTELCALARQIEKLCQSGDIAAGLSRVPALIELADASLAALEARLDQPFE